MKKIAKVATFKLSVLTTLMLCVTANNYASDIEIYRAALAGDGKARVVLNLDNSSFVSPEPSGTSGGSTSIQIDYPNAQCPNPEKYFTERESVTYNGKTYTFDAMYCPDKDNSAIKYYSRLTMIKRSALSVINNPNLGEGIQIGLSFFPKHTAIPVDGSANVTRPIPLTAANREILSNIVTGLRISQTNDQEKQVPVAQGYGDAADALLKTSTGADIAADQCSGYGILTLTSGSPVDDSLAYSKTKIDSVLASGNALSPTLCTGGAGQSATAGAAWQCVNQAATLLAAGMTKIKMPVKSTVVAFGTGFSFSPKFRDYDAELTTDSRIDADYTAAYQNNIKDVLGDQQWAAKTGLHGKGGYYSVKDEQAVANRILAFIEEVKNVDIPFITTGAPTIPQDPLHPALVQTDAYYSQFKPTPIVGQIQAHKLWVGNMKKYHLNNLGRLIGKNDKIVLDDIGRIAEGVYDYWAPPVSSVEATQKADVKTRGSELFARMGGVYSQLKLGTIIKNTVTEENRKVLTNRTVTSTGVSGGTTLNEVRRRDWATTDPQYSNLMKLLDERQVGAVLHSSPLLLSNRGKVNYNSTADSITTTNREDYVLFGSTQGVLHVVKVPDYTETTASDGTVTSSNEGGKEVFAFVPHEMIQNQSDAFKSVETTQSRTTDIYYGVDGPWTAYTEYVPESNGILTVGRGKSIGDGGNLQGKQLVYGGLRMGGRSYYSLDLKDMNNPALKFHIDPASQKVYYNNNSTTFSELQYMGQSWSKPKIAWVNWNGGRKLVMFVGGGYDMGYESDTYDQASSTRTDKGAGVYMFDALNGNLLWWASKDASATSSPDARSGVIAVRDANIQYSVVNEIKTVDRDNDGLVDHLYFGDLGGQVFRIDLDNHAAAIGSFAKPPTRLLNLHQNNGTSPRFYAAPSFAIFKDAATDHLFAAVSIGSGNLSHPLAEYTSTTAAGRNFDALYTVYDKDVARDDLYSITPATANVTLNTTTTNDVLKLNELTSANRFSNSSIVAPYALTGGWYFKFKGVNGDANTQQEKVFFSPSVIDYDLYLSTFDSGDLGLTGACGGGVQGTSRVRLFCMPFGQCAASRGYSNEDNASDKQGYGILNHAIGGVDGGMTRVLADPRLTTNLNESYLTKSKLISQRWYEK
jgi:type IV pilus assembly protein PilY1